ncbi:MAG TPA: hypothetical protein VFN75_11875 [Pseudonocardiaceae bacterium]|nr:hypothetical protein [Pseudonocardiaceae bacterium]
MEDDHVNKIRNRYAIPATCATHGGARGFTNVVITKRGAEVEIDPHATGACVIIFDEEGATAFRDILAEWLG